SADDSPSRVVTILLNEQGPRCARCGQRDSANRQLFRPVRLGAPFYLGVAVPALLEQLGSHESNERLPAGGRRLLTFNDSRPGTAYFAARTQFEAERMYVRGFIYHCLWRDVTRPDPQKEARLLSSIDSLKAAQGQGLSGIIDEK